MPDEPQVPNDPSEITAEWLGAALVERFPEVRVDSVAVEVIRHGTNTHARLRVSYAEAAGIPERLFLKLPPLDHARRAAVNQTGMGRREALFYQCLADAVPMRVPRPYVSRFEESGAFVLVLEELEASGCDFPDLVEALAPKQARIAMRDFAALHVRYEDTTLRDQEAGWVERMPRGSQYGTSMLQIGLDHHRNRLTDAFADLAMLYIAEQAALEEIWDRGPVTLLQGDGHIGNLFEDPGEAGRPGFLDWGLIQLGNPMRDVGYFLIMALSPETRRRHQIGLIREYLRAREALGGSALSFDEAFFAYRVHASYAVPASCPIVTFPKKVPSGSAAFLRRAELAIEDLEARAAIKEIAGI